MTIIEKLQRALTLLRSGHIDAAYDLIEDALAIIKGKP
jgi:hypothetical protein